MWTRLAQACEWGVRRGARAGRRRRAEGVGRGRRAGAGVWRGRWVVLVLAGKLAARASSTLPPPLDVALCRSRRPSPSPPRLPACPPGLPGVPAGLLPPHDVPLPVGRRAGGWWVGGGRNAGMRARSVQVTTGGRAACGGCPRAAQHSVRVARRAPGPVRCCAEGCPPFPARCVLTFSTSPPSTTTLPPPTATPFGSCCSASRCRFGLACAGLSLEGPSWQEGSAVPASLCSLRASLSLPSRLCRLLRRHMRRHGPGPSLVTCLACWARSLASRPAFPHPTPAPLPKPNLGLSRAPACGWSPTWRWAALTGLPPTSPPSGSHGS